MKSINRLGRGRVALAAAAVFAVAGGIAYASIPDASGVIHACSRTSLDDQKGQVRVVEDPASCRSNEAPIQWSQTGPAGPAGAAGDDGDDGVSPTVAQLAAGDPNCPAGGAAITDAAGTTAYVCSGQDGANGTPFSGTFTSPNGQYSISVTDTGVTVASPDSSIRVLPTEIKIETMGSDRIVARSGTGIEIRGGTSVEVLSDTSLLLRAALATLEGQASLNLKGTPVRINGDAGCRAVARVGDQVTNPPDGAPGSIFTGAPTVCVG